MSVNANIALCCMLEMETMACFLSKVDVTAVPVIHPVVNPAWDKLSSPHSSHCSRKIFLLVCTLLVWWYACIVDGRSQTEVIATCIAVTTHQCHRKLLHEALTVILQSWKNILNAYLSALVSVFSCQVWELLFVIAAVLIPFWECPFVLHSLGLLHYLKVKCSGMIRHQKCEFRSVLWGNQFIILPSSLLLVFLKETIAMITIYCSSAVWKLLAQPQWAWDLSILSAGALIRSHSMLALPSDLFRAAASNLSCRSDLSKETPVVMEIMVAFYKALVRSPLLLDEA